MLTIAGVPSCRLERGGLSRCLWHKIVLIAHSKCVSEGPRAALAKVYFACCPWLKRKKGLQTHTVAHSVGQDWQPMDDAVRPKEEIVFVSRRLPRFRFRMDIVFGVEAIWIGTRPVSLEAELHIYPSVLSL